MPVQTTYRRAGDRSAHGRHVGAAEQAVYADLARPLGGAGGVGGRQADDFQIARCTRRLDPAVELVEHRGANADILEADMADTEIGDLIEDAEAVLDRQVVLRQHEDEIHGDPVDQVARRPLVSIFAPRRSPVTRPRAGTAMPDPRGASATVAVSSCRSLAHDMGSQREI